MASDVYTKRKTIRRLKFVDKISSFGRLKFFKYILLHEKCTQFNTYSGGLAGLLWGMSLLGTLQTLAWSLRKTISSLKFP